ncbi:MAG: wax ester/triacylglycerol synthase family O-acyltransferase [Caldilineaceae bacterium]|nr:wax ester/triacylglycerol synthase family O-acyltransferase [Caldilineaceae bacterium]MBP8110174.1 wax ester/triacylglycerol synthase family O-acyltransferase [Caldilineaceae bacterium]MBP9072169.1 wax ester/triacylglycerol synthase family O-acyltransferase [Caldilineaceae bacterium]
MADNLRRETMRSVDTAWLRMDDPTNLMIINGVMMFRGTLDLERVRRMVEIRMLRFHRFRQRVVEQPLGVGAPYWEDDPNFHINSHVKRLALPDPGDDQTLQELVGDMMAVPMDLTKPPWQIYVIENYHGHDQHGHPIANGTVVFTRLHHCIADGMALVQVFLSLTDEQADAPEGGKEPSRRSRRDDAQSDLPPLLRLLQSRARTAVGLGRSLLNQGSRSLSNPFYGLGLTRLAVELATDSAAELANLALMPPDPQTVLKGKLGVAKSVAWSEPIALADVKAIGKATGATVNDVLMTAATAALRSYIQGRGESADGVEVRAAIPVNLRPPGKTGDLGNNFALVFLSLPVGIGTTQARLKEVKKRMDALKGSAQAMVAYGILQALGRMPGPVESQAVQFFASKATTVLTNVPGPQQPLYFTGNPIEKILFWVPQSGRLGMGISIFSYNGTVTLGVATDTGLVPDPEQIVAGFHTAFGELLALVEEELPAQTPSLPPAGRSAVEDVGGFCAAHTKTGNPCRNRPMAESAYCRVHQAAG